MDSKLANVYVKGCSTFYRSDQASKHSIGTDTGYVVVSLRAIGDRDRLRRRHAQAHDLQQERLDHKDPPQDHHVQEQYAEGSLRSHHEAGWQEDPEYVKIRRHPHYIEYKEEVALQ